MAVKRTARACEHDMRRVYVRAGRMWCGACGADLGTLDAALDAFEADMHERRAAWPEAFDVRRAKLYDLGDMPAHAQAEYDALAAPCCTECGHDTPGALRAFNDRAICARCYVGALDYARLHLTAEERGEPWPVFETLPAWMDGGRV